MNPLTTSEIHGNWARPITPWRADESLDIHRLGADIDARIGFGVDGIHSKVACLKCRPPACPRKPEFSTLRIMSFFGLAPAARRASVCRACHP